MKAHVSVLKILLLPCHTHEWRHCADSGDAGDEQATIVTGPGGIPMDANIQYQIRADTGQGQYLLHAQYCGRKLIILMCY